MDYDRWELRWRIKKYEHQWKRRHISHLQYSHDTYNRSLLPTECEVEGVSLSTTVTYTAYIYRTVCDKLKSKNCQFSKEEWLSELV